MRHGRSSAPSARTPGAHTLVAASAGNHGRAVAHVAGLRGLACRVFLPERSLAVRREAIASEGAEVVVVDGTYEDAVAEAEAAAAAPGVLLIADVGDSGPARWVIDGYATLFAEAAAQADYEVILVPVGVGSLAAAAARHGAAAGVTVIGVEPEAAACLTASLAAGRPTSVDTPGTTMAGLDCAEVSPAAWPDLRDGIHSTVTVSDAEAAAAMASLRSTAWRSASPARRPWRACASWRPAASSPGSASCWWRPRALRAPPQGKCPDFRLQSNHRTGHSPRKTHRRVTTRSGAPPLHPPPFVTRLCAAGSNHPD